MHTTSRTQVKRIERYLEELKRSRLQPHHEIVLSELTGLMSKIGFIGPVGKGGAQVGFYHELLEDVTYLTGGRFGVHIIHGGGHMQKIRYRDFKIYILPHIEEVLVLLEQNNLISEDDSNV